VQLNCYERTRTGLKAAAANRLSALTNLHTGIHTFSAHPAIFRAVNDNSGNMNSPISLVSQLHQIVYPNLTKGKIRGTRECSLVCVCLSDCLHKDNIAQGRIIQQH
jgi:hypothetical protein